MKRRSFISKAAALSAAFMAAPAASKLFAAAEATGIAEIFGSYAAAEAHAGAVQSAGAQVMTKGEVSLAWSGKGRGFDLGIAFGKLTISK